MRFRLRTLLIVLAIAPPIMAVIFHEAALGFELLLAEAIVFAIAVAGIAFCAWFLLGSR